MQRATSTVKKAFSRSVTVTRSPASKASSRSPSSATVPACCCTVTGSSGARRCQLATGTGSTSPGAIGCMQHQQRVRRVGRQLHRQAATLAPAHRLQQTADRRQADRLGLGKGQVGRGQRAGLPQGARADAAVMRDHRVDDGDVAPLRAAVTRVDQHLEQLVGHQRFGRQRCARRRTSPAASPVMVGSRISGKALLVPVDRPAIGSEGCDALLAHQLAHHRAVRAVTAQHDDCAGTGRLQHARGGEAVLDAGGRARSSATRCVGRLASPRLRWRSSSARMPPRSGISSARATPAARAACSTRSTMLTRSVICRLPALATMRRMSRADTGLAITPSRGCDDGPVMPSWGAKAMPSRRGQAFSQGGGAHAAG